MNNKKYRFNIIDVLLVLIIVAIVGIMYYFTVARNDVVTNSEVTVDYTIELKTVRSEHVNKIKIGDNAVETVRDQQIGEVVDIQIVPAYNLVTNMLTGEMHKETYPAINAPIVSDGDDNELSLTEQTEENVSENVEPTELLYDYYNVKVTIRNKVKKSEAGYKINGFDVIVGEQVYFRVPEFVGSGYCINIVEVAE